MTTSKRTKRTPQQVILFSLVEATDVTWFREGMSGDPSAVVKAMKVDFQRGTVTLPEGKFDLDHFLHKVGGILSMLSYHDNTNQEPS